MQSTSEASHFWQNVWTLLAGGGIATTIGVIAKAIVDRRKLKPDIDESKARTKLTLADANSKDVDSMGKLFDLLLRAQKTIDEERHERRAVSDQLESTLEKLANVEEENCQLREENQKFKDNLRLD
jgi:hypothetical protein